MEKPLTSKPFQFGLKFTITWVNRLFFLINVVYASGVVYIYSVRPESETGPLSISSHFGENAPLFGSPFLEFIVGYPTGVILSLIFLFSLWTILKQKIASKKFICNCILFVGCTVLGCVFSISALIAMSTLVP